MIDALTQTMLRDLVRRELRSLLQYLAESFPWSTPDKAAIVTSLRRMAGESREAAARITRFLRNHYADLPYLGAYPMEFTNINFIGLDYALKRLVNDEQLMVSYLGSRLPELAEGEASQLLQELLTLKQAHLQELEGFTGQVTATTVR